MQAVPSVSAPFSGRAYIELGLLFMVATVAPAAHGFSFRLRAIAPVNHNTFVLFLKSLFLNFFSSFPLLLRLAVSPAH